MNRTTLAIWGFKRYPEYCEASNVPYEEGVKHQQRLGFITLSAANSLEVDNVVKQAIQQGFEYFHYFILSVNEGDAVTVRERTADRVTFFQKLKVYWRCQLVWVFEFTSDANAHNAVMYIGQNPTTLDCVSHWLPSQGVSCCNKRRLLIDVLYLLPQMTIPSNFRVYTVVNASAVLLLTWTDIEAQIGEFDKPE